MGDTSDANSIETLRKLALLSMPKRQLQGRNLTRINPSLKSDGHVVLSSPAAQPEDKEEGELSSDDDAEGAPATFTSVSHKHQSRLLTGMCLDGHMWPLQEPTLSHSRNQDALNLYTHPQGSSKEMIAPVTTFTGSDSHQASSAYDVAEAFLASLRIPLPKTSRASGDEKKEDAFVIKFDEDSDSDGEQQHPLIPSSTNLGNSEKPITSIFGLSNTTQLLQISSGGSNQNPSGLKSEIDRMKKQIAAMERSKGKPPMPPVGGKTGRVVLVDTTGRSVSPATDTKSVLQVGSGNSRSVPDLESLRLQIAAKENELQQRRQRLAAKGPEAGRAVNDLKSTSVGLSSPPQPPLSRTMKDPHHHAGPPVFPVSKIVSEKMVTGPRKENLNAGEGLAITDPAGGSQAGYKKDGKQNGLNSFTEDHNVGEETTKPLASRAEAHLNNPIFRQSINQGTKRSYLEVEPESTKVARVDGRLSGQDSFAKANSSNESTLQEITSLGTNGTHKPLTVQSSSQFKRKLDESEIPFKTFVDTPGSSDVGYPDVSKKLKTDPQAVPKTLARGDSVANHNQLGFSQTPQASEPVSSAGFAQVLFPSENFLLSTSKIIGVATPPTVRSTIDEAEDVPQVPKVSNIEQVVSRGERGGERIKTAIVPSAELPRASKGLLLDSLSGDDHLSKVQKPRSQYEGSHALAALPGVSVSDSGVTEAVVMGDPGTKKHDTVSSNQHAIEGMQTAVYLTRSNLLLPSQAHTEHQVQQSSARGDSVPDDWDLDPDIESFDQLQAEEELLDKELEEAQEERHRCERRERVARKEYREAQKALRTVNEQCDLLNHRRELLYSRIHIAEGRQYARKLSRSRAPWLGSSVDNSSFKMIGPKIGRAFSPEKLSNSVARAISLPLPQPSEDAGLCDASGEHVQVAECRVPLAMKQAEATVVSQQMTKNCGSPQVVEGDDAGVAIPDGGSQPGIARGLSRNLDLASQLVDNKHVEKQANIAFVPQTGGVQLTSSRPTKTLASMSILHSQLHENASSILEARTPNKCGPKGQHFGSSGRDKSGCVLERLSESTTTEGTQLRVTRESSLSRSEKSAGEGKDILEGTTLSTGDPDCKLSFPGKCDEHVQSLQSNSGITPLVHGRQEPLDLGPSSCPVDTLAEEIPNHAQYTRIESQESEQGGNVPASSALERYPYVLRTSMTTGEEEKHMKLEKTDQVLVEKETVENVFRIAQEWSLSKGKVADVSTFVAPVCTTRVIAPGVVPCELGKIGQDRQVLRDLISATSETFENNTSTHGDILKGTNRSVYVLSPHSKDQDLRASELQVRNDGDALEEAGRLGIQLSIVEDNHGEHSVLCKLSPIEEERTFNQIVEAQNITMQDLVNTECLAIEQQGKSSGTSNLNALGELDFATVAKLVSEATEEGCFLSEVDSTPGRFEEIGGSSRDTLDNQRRPYPDSEDLSTWSKDVQPGDRKKTMSSNNSCDEQPMYRSPNSGGGCGDTDMMKLDQEIRSSDTGEIPKKGYGILYTENMESLIATGDHSCRSRAWFGTDLQIRHKRSGGVSQSVEVQGLPSGQLSHGATNDYLSTTPSFDRDGEVVTTNDCCSSEVGKATTLRDSGDQEKSSTFLSLDARQEQPVRVPFPGIKELVSRADQTKDLLGREDLQAATLHSNHRMEGELSMLTVLDPEANKDHQARQNMNAVILEDIPFEEDTVNSKSVEKEVFEVALLDGSLCKGGESVAEMKVHRQHRDTVVEQVSPRLQCHVLNQLSDTVRAKTRDAETDHEQEKRSRDPPKTVLKDKCNVEIVTSQVGCLKPAMECSEGHERCEEIVEAALHISSSGLTERELIRRDSVACERWVPSAVSLVSLKCIPRVEFQCSETPAFDTTFFTQEKGCFSDEGSPSVLPRYESPLSVFRSYRSSPQFEGAMHLSSSSRTWSHAINPHKPLCRFEHRGQCRNEHCPWQHADDYALSSSQIFNDIGNIESPSVLDLDKDLDGNSRTCEKDILCIASSRSAGISGVESTSEPQNAGSLVLSSHASLSQGSSSLKRHDDEVSVPTYRIGSYTLKADDPGNMRIVTPGIQRKGKTDLYHSFLLSPSIHRALPLDSPCLLDTSKSRSLVIEVTDASEPPLWRYTGNLQEEQVFGENGALHGSIDIEMWLELALNHIDFDIGSDKPKARDEALCILSRGLETRPDSVPLWMAYSCLFHTRKGHPETDDMFQFAIQYNPGSYELWLLYIKSRPDLATRMRAYERAIGALAEKGPALELVREDLSACLLDIALQMIYCMCVSGCTQDALSWVDDLVHDASISDLVEPKRGSTSSLLSHLTPHDACILWICCSYLLACAELPVEIITRIGCKQNLPYSLDWETRASTEPSTSILVLQTIRTAASSSRGCLSLEEPHKLISDKNIGSKEVLGVNYIQCLAIYEGLDSAARLSRQLISLYPTSTELVLIYARIQEQRAGTSAGLLVFEEAVSRWPVGEPGIQRLWNQYAGYGLLLGGNDLFYKVLSQSLKVTLQPADDDVEESPSRFLAQANSSTTCSDPSIVTSLQAGVPESGSQLREHYLALTSIGKRRGEDFSASTSLPGGDSVYALINLALIKALDSDRVGCLSAINRAMNPPILERDMRQCWKELASLQFANFSFPKSHGLDVSEHSMLRLLDRCKIQSQLLLKPLSRKALEDLKRPHVRKFFIDLLGPQPMDHSLLNSILNVWYGPSLLPSECLTVKDVFHFAEGLLEAMPGNVEVAISLCKMVFQEGGPPTSKSLSSTVWASALLISSLQQSCPVAPESYWVEAGIFLRHLGREKSLQEYYLHALVKYPFSAALQRGLEEARLRLQGPEWGGLQQMDTVSAVAEPLEG